MLGLKYNYNDPILQTNLLIQLTEKDIIDNVTNNGLKVLSFYLFYYFKILKIWNITKSKIYSNK